MRNTFLVCTLDLTYSLSQEFAEVFADLNHIFFGTARDRRQVDKTMCLIGIFMIMTLTPF